MTDLDNEQNKSTILKHIKVANLVNRKRFSDNYVIGEPTKNVYMYKYMNMSVAIKAICDGYITIRFQQPSKWDDEYERLFYEANYSEVTKDSRTHPKLYACCFSFSNHCAAAWREYRGNIGLARNCVRLHICKTAFRQAIADYAEYNGFKVYEGAVDYRDEYLITNLLNPSSSDENIVALHNELFGGDFKIDNYLSLLLLKRNLFSFEDEFRFFLVPTRGKLSNNIDVKIPIRPVVEKIMISDKCDGKSKKKFLGFCKKEGIDEMVEEAKIYRLDNTKIGVTIKK